MTLSKTLLNRDRIVTVARIVIAILLIGTYVLLLPPYIIHSAQDRTGFVVDTEMIELGNLPEPVRLYLTENSTWTVAIIEHVYPNRTDAIITDKSFPLGSLVEVVGTKAVWITDWRDFDFGSEFGRLIISDSLIARASTGSCPKPISLQWFLILSGGLRTFENCLEISLAKSEETNFVTLSRIAYLGGPFLVTLAALIVNKKLKLWSLATALWLYTVQLLFANQLLLLHNTMPDSTLLVLGYLAIPLPVAIYLIRRWENSPSGKSFLAKAFRGV